ncbi:MAG TPA: ribonuclease HI family protein [Actinomycetota bacterium]|nr:ribonuclease HI family protein [Actinomycetota bacterium]
MRASLYCDGGARGNPGPAGIGVVLLSEDGNLLAQLARSIGHATNNVAEYTALIAGLELAQARGVTDLDVFLDSELVVSQLKGEWKIKKDQLRSLAARAELLLNRFENFSISHVPRAQNADADKLANQAMDAAAEGIELSTESVQQNLFEN